MTSSQLAQALDEGTISRELYDSMHPYIGDSAKLPHILLALEKEFENILKKDLTTFEPDARLRK